MPENPSAAPRFLSVSEAARILKVSKVTLYRAINAGEFPAVPIRGRYVIPAKALDTLEATALAQAGTAELPGRGTSERWTA